MDTRIVKETREGTYTYTGSNGGKRGLIDSQKDVGGWPEYKMTTAWTDTDGDGMPDEWERKVGLNPDNGKDGTDYNLSPCYTNLEVYLNELVKDTFPTNESLNIKLK